MDKWAYSFLVYKCTNISKIWGIKDKSMRDLTNSQKQRANTEKTTTSEEDVNDNSKDRHNEECTAIESSTRIDEKIVHLYTNDEEESKI